MFALPRSSVAHFALVLVLALAGAVAWVGCGSSSAGSALALPPPAALPASSSSHVVVVVMENREFSDVIGSADAPYVNALAGRYALATAYHAISHPSLPNYLALTGGSTFGISSDCTDCNVGARNLVDQFAAAHVSWRAYMEGMPRPCDPTAGVGGYAKKHNPFLYYTDVAGNRARCANVVPYARLAGDLRRGRLASFVWISPNLCNDGHDCSNRTADRFLARLVPALIAELGPHGALFLVWDEGTSDSGCCRLAAGGVVPLIAAGPDTRRHARSATPYDHYSLLRTIDAAFGLAPLGHAACPCTTALNGLFSRPPRLRARAR